MTSVDHLTDPDFYNHALRYREKKILLSISNRMQKYLKRRIKPSEAFLKVQVHMMDLAKAYIERLAYKEFAKKIDSIEDGDEKNILIKLSQLFALTVIEEDKGWYLEAFPYSQAYRSRRCFFLENNSRWIRTIRLIIIKIGLPTYSRIISFQVPHIFDQLDMYMWFPATIF